MGLSSGPGADGVDAALVSIAGRGERMKVKQLHTAHFPLPDVLSSRVRAMGEGANGTSGSLAELDRDVANAFAEAALGLIGDSRIDREQIVAVGSSGQVVACCTAAEPENTGGTGGALELGSPPVITQAIGLPVVAGFAASDLAVGGLGGPLTAWTDWLVFRDRRLSRVVVHLGGIISISFVPAAAVSSDVVAFHVAPGTIVLDALAREHMNCPFDRDGGIASRGRASSGLVNELLSHPYFHTSPPKVTHPEQWGKAYRKRLEGMARRHRASTAADQIATFTETIARSITNAVATLTERPHEIVLTGGAARNIHLAQRIRMLLSPSSTYSAEHYGFALRAYNAACYAVLAAARIDRKPVHCPSATGANRPAIRGAIWIP